MNPQVYRIHGIKENSVTGRNNDIYELTDNESLLNAKQEIVIHNKERAVALWAKVVLSAPCGTGIRAPLFVNGPKGGVEDVACRQWARDGPS